jgi:PAS domain S-box-containing protein
MMDQTIQSTMPLPQDFAGWASFVLNGRAGTLSCSKDLTALLGVDTPPQTAAAMIACFHPSDRHRAERLLFSEGARVHPQEMELQVAHFGGAIRYLNIRTKHSDGDPEELHGLVVDVTATRVRATDERTDRVEPNINVGQYHYDIREKLSWWSGSLYRMFDVSAQPAMDPNGKMLESVHPSDRHILKELLERVATKVGPYEVSYRILRPDGSVRHILDRGEVEGPLDEKTGLSRAARGVLIDVTERQTGIEMATQAFDDLIEGALFGAYLVDADMRIVRISQGAQSAFQGVEDVIGRDLGEVMRQIWPEPFAADIVEKFYGALSTGTPYRAKFALEERRDVGAVESYDWSVQRIVMTNGRFGCLCHFCDLTDVDSTVDTLRDDASTLQMVLDNAVAFIGVLDRNGTLTEANEPALVAGGLERGDVIGKKFWHAPWWTHSAERVIELKKAIVRARKGDIVRYDAEVMMSGGRRMMIDFLLSPIRDADGEVENIVASGFDITERTETENQVRLLMGEINHRSKNVLTLVQSIARLTDRSSPEAFLDTFEGRLQALASSYDAIIKDKNKGARLADLARAQLAHLSDLTDGRIMLEGPDVDVTTEAAQGLSMAFHELATNAAKYGALSTEKGRIHITWARSHPDTEDETALEVSWRESGGPPVRTPARTGFGSTVLGPMAQSALNAQVDLRYDPAGLEWNARCGQECLAE